MGTKYKVLVLLLLCVLSFGCAHKKSPAVDDSAVSYTHLTLPPILRV